MKCRTTASHKIGAVFLVTLHTYVLHLHATRYRRGILEFLPHVSGTWWLDRPNMPEKQPSIYLTTLPPDTINHYQIRGAII